MFLTELFHDQSATKTLYVDRPLINGHDIIDWAKTQGFDHTLNLKDFHVTVAYSKNPVDHTQLRFKQDTVIIPPSKQRSVERLGEHGAIVLRFESDQLQQRWTEFKNVGASWDYTTYKPHITISYKDTIDISKVEPYYGVLKFGHEVFKPINPNWADTVKSKKI